MSTPDHAINQQIFSLTQGDIRSLVAAAVGSQLEECSVIERQMNLPGLAAEKVLARHRYRTSAGAMGEVSLFWKRMYGLDIAESHQYRLLADHEIPTPTLHGTAFGAQEEEIIVLETLDAVGIDHDDPREVREFVSLLARLNAIRLRSEDPWKPPAHEIARQLADGGIMAQRVERIWAEAAAGTMSPDLMRWCGRNAEVAGILVRRGIELGSHLRRLPRSILHEDYTPPNTGWRAGRTQFVLFDLHRISLGPRFWDAGIALGSADAPAFPCLPWDELARFYLAELDRFGGPSAPFAVFLDEVALARNCSELDNLKWNLREVLWFRPGGPPDHAVHAPRALQRLLDRLELLAREVA